MTNKLLTERHLEFLRLTEGWSGSFESIYVKMPHCCKSHVAAKISFSFFSRCKKGLLSCSNRKEKKPKKEDSKKKPTRPSTNNKTRQRRKKNRNGKRGLCFIVNFRLHI